MPSQAEILALFETWRLDTAAIATLTGTDEGRVASALARARDASRAARLRAA